MLSVKPFKWKCCDAVHNSAFFAVHEITKDVKFDILYTEKEQTVCRILRGFRRVSIISTLLHLHFDLSLYNIPCKETIL